MSRHDAYNCDFWFFGIKQEYCIKIENKLEFKSRKRITISSKDFNIYYEL